MKACTFVVFVYSILSSLAQAQSRPAGVGAAYFMTNLAQNHVVSSAIQADGTLAFAGITSTYGQGSTGSKMMPGPDPLFSQDSIKVSGSYLYAVNAGSNTISTFKIKPSDPTNLMMVGSPVSSGGDFPVSIVIASKRDMVCVLNGGANNGVSCYKKDSMKGLVPLQNTIRSLHLPQTTPPSGPAGTVSDIIFSKDETKLLVAVKGMPPTTPGYLAAWDIKADRSLSDTFKASVPAAGGLLPFSMTPIKGKNALLVTDPAVGFSIYNLDTLSLAHNTSATSSIVAVPGQKAICWSNYSPRTGSYYLSDAGTSTIVEARVNNSLQGSVVKQYPLVVNSTSLDNAIASLPAKDYLYVLSASITSIDVLALNGPGYTSHIQSFNFAPALMAVGVVASSQRLQGLAVYMK